MSWGVVGLGKRHREQGLLAVFTVYIFLEREGLVNLLSFRDFLEGFELFAFCGFPSLPSLPVS